MPLNTISKILDIIIKFLALFIGIWIVFYALDRPLQMWLGYDWYAVFYTWISRLISFGVLLLVIFVILFVLNRK